MSEGKISFTLGNLSFTLEGSENWVGQQMEKIIAAIPTLAPVAKPVEPEHKQTNGGGQSGTPFTESLASFLKSKGAEGNQNKSFLATAGWLRRRGNTTLTTAMVSKALKDNQQKRLGNAAECLNQNVGKGFCEKTSDGFYISPEGLKSLGEE